jgi:hypothetical protein
MRGCNCIGIIVAIALVGSAFAQEGAAPLAGAVAPLDENAVTTGGVVTETLDGDETLPKFDVVPPLGLDDAMQTVEDCIYFLETPEARFRDYRKQKVTDAIASVIDYMKIVDDRNSSQENYRWYSVGRQKVSRGGVDEDTFLVEPPLRRVSAISFAAERGDITVHRMTVSDAQGNETKFTIERLVRADFPRKEVCFLYYQQSVKQIVLYYSTNEREAGPRLRVYCGVTPLPEYAKEAIYFLTVAKKEIAQDQLAGAVDNLRKAWKRMLRLKGVWLRE